MRLFNKLALFGVFFILFGLLLYLIGITMAIPRRIFFDTELALQINHFITWYSGFPIIVGFLMMLYDILYMLSGKNKKYEYQYMPLQNKNVTVILTAYNDEDSIGASVRDFLSHPLVLRVLVISNNSSDKTMENAAKAGAIVYNEANQGYGACVHRALSEGVKYSDTEVTVLCEGDMTFRAYDIDKLLAYIPHCDIVNGSRIVYQLKEKHTQLSTFMYYGNLFVGKLLELKYLGVSTLTDVGTTYKMCRNSALEELLPQLNPDINLEFNPYLLDTALSMGLKIVECPITFHARIGESKGGNINNYVALKLGLKMIYGVVLKW